MSDNGRHPEVLYQAGGAVATITINRPYARNSVNKKTCLALYQAVRQADENPKLSVVVLRGEGKDFCCGADLKAESQRPDESDAPRPETDIHRISVLLHEMRAVTVAAIRGGCAGAGFGWACACDFRVAADSSVFNTAFLNVGVAGDMAVPWTLPRIIGASRARELSFFPGKFDAQLAYDIGLINRLWPEAEFENSLEGFTQQLSSHSPEALAALKANYIAAERQSLEEYVMLEADAHIRLLGTQASKDAFAAHRKKKPNS